MCDVATMLAAIGIGAFALVIAFGLFIMTFEKLLDIKDKIFK